MWLDLIWSLFLDKFTQWYLYNMDRLSISHLWWGKRDWDTLITHVHVPQPSCRSHTSTSDPPVTLCSWHWDLKWWGKKVCFWCCYLLTGLVVASLLLFLLSTAPSQAPGKIMWNTSNSKVILRWDQVHALENESEVTGYKVEAGKHGRVYFISHLI